MKYQNITHDDILNGEGIRVVLWVSGCSHECKGCHNPITWDPSDGIEFGQDAKDEIFEQLNKDYISGITFSGGDPLYIDNKDVVLQFISEIKKQFPNKTIWLYTGYSFEDILEWDIDISDIDILIDGEFIEELKDDNLQWIGSSNQRIINVKETLKQKEIILYENKI